MRLLCGTADIGGVRGASCFGWRQAAHDDEMSSAGMAIPVLLLQEMIGVRGSDGGVK